MTILDASLALASAASARNAQPRAWSDGISWAFGQSSGNVTVTAPTSTNTKTGATYAQLVSSTTSRTGALMVQLSGNAVAATDTSTLLDIAVGGSGSEVVVVPDIAMGAANGLRFFVPINIPSGSRVAARIQSAVASRAVTVNVNFIDAGNADRLPTSLDVLGVTTATSTGTAMSGASGSWTAITASTSKDYQAIVLIPSLSTTTMAARSVRLSLGIGAAGSEREVAFFNGASATTPGITDTSATGNGGFSTAGLFVPAGSRISVRHNQADNPGRVYACVLGVPYV